MPTTTYVHFRDVPESIWRWPSFSPAEIACRGTGAIKINTEAMAITQVERQKRAETVIGCARCCAWPNPHHHR